MRKLQFEVPNFTKPTDYSFPYWTEEDRVIGQPVNHLLQKYKTTYGRVVQTMIEIGPRKFTELTPMGLIATNRRSLIDFLQFEFKRWHQPIPSVKQVGIVELRPDTYRLIKTREEEIDKKKFGQLSLVNTLLKHITYSPKSIGRPPKNWQDIVRFQNKLAGQVNFLDCDFMCNWGKEWEFSCIPGIIDKFTAPTAVIHVNAIREFPRTWPWNRSEQEIEEILFEQVLSKLNRKFSNVTLSSYTTRNFVTTEMTSVVFAVDG